MLIYNTTFHVEMGDARNFVIWLNESTFRKWKNRVN